MSAAVATAPAVEVGSARASIVRMVVVSVAYMAIVLATTIYPLVSPLRRYLDAPTPLEQAIYGLTATIWLASLLVSLWRQPRGRLWKLIFLLGVTSNLGALGFVPESWTWSIAHVIGDVGLAFYVHLLVAFPSGYLRDRFDRLVVAVGYAYVSAWMLLQFALGGEWVVGCEPDCVRNLFVFWQDGALYQSMRGALTVFAVSLLVPLVLWALWRHWRDAGPAARRTLLPLIVAVPLMAVVLAAERLSSELGLELVNDFFGTSSGTLITLLVPMILPIGLLIGILRTRLTRGRIANLVVELGRGVPVGGLRDVLARTLDDATLELAFAAPSGTGFVDAAGQPVELPVGDPSRTVTRLERDGELLGVLIHDPAIEAEDPGLVEAVGNAARLALENERLAAEVRAQLEEVRASRLRIVEATDAERRRVERDLHDGAQQRLVALAMRLQLAKETSDGSSALLDEATEELQTAIGEVRGLARGIHPTILTEAGLRAAVDSLAERTPVPVSVDVVDRRFDPQIEAAAYFVIAEALTNVARYSGATEASVTGAVDDGRLIVTVTDDGRGGADPAAGSGLRGLSDRLSALDGRLAVASPPGSGTTVRAELPLASPSRATTGAGPAPSPAASNLSSARVASQAKPDHTRASRVRLSNPAVLITVLAVAILLVAAIAALPAMQQRAPDNGRAATFVRPFDYQVPNGDELALDAKSDHLQVLGPGKLGGISIWAVEDVLVDNCPWDEDDPPGAVRPREPGVDGLLHYIRSVDRIRVRDLPSRTIDGRPASVVELTVKDGDAGCLDHPEASILLWRDTSPGGHGVPMQVPAQGLVPLTVVDVDGTTVAIEVWTGYDIDDWLPSANGILDSIRFHHVAPATSSPPNATILK